MKIKDARKILDFVEAHGICIEAKRTAERSLDAWEQYEALLEQLWEQNDGHIRDGIELSLHELRKIRRGIEGR